MGGGGGGPPTKQQKINSTCMTRHIQREVTQKRKTPTRQDTNKGKSFRSTPHDVTTDLRVKGELAWISWRSKRRRAPFLSAHRGSCQLTSTEVLVTLWTATFGTGLWGTSAHHHHHANMAMMVMIVCWLVA